jgi:hypothetical protein
MLRALRTPSFQLKKKMLHKTGGGGGGVEWVSVNENIINLSHNEKSKVIY